MALPALDMDRVAAIMREVAAAEVLPRFGALAADDVRQKRPGDLVTVADQQAERRLAAELTTLLPGSTVVGEEMVDADPGLLGRLAGDAPVWIVDPLDGTRNFASGKRCFATIVALNWEGATVAGWIHDPLGGRTIAAERGAGTRLDGEPVSRVTPVSLGRMCGSVGVKTKERLLARGLEFSGLVRYGSAGREEMDLALGILHFALYGAPVKPWDHAAGVLIFEEAGGRARLLPTETPYQARQGLVRERLLYAPDAATWNEIAALLRSL